MATPDDRSWNTFDVNAIAPRKGSKYSPNLYAWLTAPGPGLVDRLARTQMYLDRSKVMWLGYWTSDGHFVGQRVALILTRGAAASTGTRRLAGALKQVDGFWETYVEFGRCALDPHHISPLVNSEFRWVKRGMGRRCCWCGRSFALPVPTDIQPTSDAWTGMGDEPPDEA